MTTGQKRIWIDCDNSPHVLFFNPIIHKLKERNYSVLLTLRDFGQVIPLAALFGLEYRVIGRHYGKNKLKKSIGLLIRSCQMIPFVKAARPQLAVSHGSRSQVLFSQLMGIPFIEAYDYEFTADIPFVHPVLTLVPEVLFTQLHRKKAHTIPYPGIKEDVYVQSFHPDPETPRLLGIDSGRVVVTIRPPATAAHYHADKSEQLFNAIIKCLTANDTLQIIILPRTDEQRKDLLRQFAEEFAISKLSIPDKVLNGLDIIWYSDLVISAGGTMIREAAALGVPAYSIFGGKIGAVDQNLEARGLLKIIRSEPDIDFKLQLTKRPQKDHFEPSNKRVCDFIVDKISELVEHLA